jgi:beta-lactamase regulating signal transducer with metallopeptidase domain
MNQRQERYHEWILRKLREDRETVCDNTVTTDKKSENKAN